MHDVCFFRTLFVLSTKKTCLCYRLIVGEILSSHEVMSSKPASFNCLVASYNVIPLGIHILYTQPDDLIILLHTADPKTIGYA